MQTITLSADWTPPNNLVPGDCTYECNGAVIRAARPDEDWIVIGPRAILHNVRIHDRFGTSHPLVMRYAPNGPRACTYLENRSATPVISTHWDGMASYINGGDYGVDSPVCVIRNIGQNSAGLYLEPHNATYGLHAWTSDQAKAIRIDHFASEPAIYINLQGPGKALSVLDAQGVEIFGVSPTGVTGTVADRLAALEAWVLRHG